MHHLLIALLLAGAVATATAMVRTIAQDLAVAHRPRPADLCARWLAERSTKAKAWWPR